MGVVVIVAGLMSSHAALPEFVDIPESVLVEAIKVTWELPSEKAELLAKGAVVGGRLGNIHWGWLLAMAYFESRFNPNVKGDYYTGKGGVRKYRAYGLCQIHYYTGRFVLKGVGRKDMFNPVVNLAMAGLLYGRFIRKYGREKAHVIYAYGLRCMTCTTTRSFKKRYKLMKKLIGNIKESR
jgi:hypothetical protein